MNIDELLTKLYDYAYYGSLGTFAALVGYLYQSAKNSENVSWLTLAATVVSGFYLGMLFATLFPAGLENRDALVLLAGAGGMKGFEVALRAGKAILSETVGRNRAPERSSEGGSDRGGDQG